MDDKIVLSIHGTYYKQHHSDILEDNHISFIYCSNIYRVLVNNYILTDLDDNLANYVHIHINVFDVRLSLIYRIMSYKKTCKSPSLIHNYGSVLLESIIRNVHMHRIIDKDIGQLCEANVCRNIYGILICGIAFILMSGNLCTCRHLGISSLFIYWHRCFYRKSYPDDVDLFMYGSLRKVYGCVLLLCYRGLF